MHIENGRGLMKKKSALTTGRKKGRQTKTTIKSGKESSLEKYGEQLTNV